jgi:hypothetical protein
MPMNPPLISTIHTSGIFMVKRTTPARTSARDNAAAAWAQAIATIREYETPHPLKVLVCGSPQLDLVSFQLVARILGHIHVTDGISLVITSLRCADLQALKFADQNGIPVATYGRGFRNLETTETIFKEQKPDLVVLFPGGSSRVAVLREAKQRNVPVLEVDALGGSALGLPVDSGIKTIRYEYPR